MTDVVAVTPRNCSGTLRPERIRAFPHPDRRGSLVRRLLISLLCAVTAFGVVLVMPVMANARPDPEPVESSTEEIPLGSVAQPAPDAEVQPGLTESEPGLAAVPVLRLSEPDTDLFSTVGVTWAQDPAVVDVLVKVRVRDAAGTWGSWTDVEVSEVDAANPDAALAGDLRGGTEPVWTNDAYGAEVEVLTRSGANPTDVRLILIDPRTAAADSIPHTDLASDTANAAASQPPIYSRAQWGADESIRSWEPEYAATIDAATVHHTADSNDYTEAEVPQILRSIYSYHAVSRGWGDIGYNAIVDKFGRTWEGRYGGLGSTVIGAHAGGFNASTFGVSMLGNYDVVGTPAVMVSSVAAVIAWKFGLYGVDPLGTARLTSGGGGTSKYPAGQVVTLPAIFGHRDVGSTTCPGQYGYAQLPEIRSQVTALTSPRLGDVSETSVAAVRAQTGQTTLAVRGTNSTIFVRTQQPNGTWGGFVQIPGGYATRGVAAVSTGEGMYVVVRGGDGGYWLTNSLFDPSGRPGPWTSWTGLGGVFTTAPSVAFGGPGYLSVVGRGTDGAVFQTTYSGSRFSGWVSLGGVSSSASSLETGQLNGQPAYVVSTVGSDGRIWRVLTGSSRPGATVPWEGGSWPTTLGPQSDAAGVVAAPAGSLTVGGQNGSVALLNPANGSRIELGGAVTSTVGAVRQPGGGMNVFGRGLDAQIWTTTWDPIRGVLGWTALGGQVA